MAGGGPLGAIWEIGALVALDEALLGLDRGWTGLRRARICAARGIAKVVAVISAAGEERVKKIRTSAAACSAR